MKVLWLPTPTWLLGTLRERRHTAMVSASLLGLQSIRMGLQLIAARFVPQVDYGWWVLGTTVMGYLAFSQLGTSSALARLVPEALARGFRADADLYGRVAIQHAAASGAAGFVVLAVAAPLGVGGWSALLGAALGVVFFTQQIANTRIALLTARQDRIGLTWRLIGISLVMAVFGLFGSIRYGVNGLAVGSAIGWLVGVVGTLRPSAATAEAPSISSRHAWARLVRNGIPITLAGTLFLLIISVDRLVVARIFDIRAAGVYGLASVAAGSVIVFQQALSTLFLPRLSLAHAGGAARADLDATASRLSMMVFRLTVLFLIIFAVAFSLLVHFVLPQYRESVVPALILATGFASFSLTTGQSNVLLARGATVVYAITLLKGIAVVSVLSFLGAVASDSLIGVASGAAAGCVATALLLHHSARNATPEAALAPNGLGE